MRIFITGAHKHLSVCYDNLHLKVAQSLYITYIDVKSGQTIMIKVRKTLYG